MFLELSSLVHALEADLNPYITNPPVEVCDIGPPSEVKMAAATYLRDSFLKKFRDHSDGADEAAVKIFHASNKKCAGWVNPLSTSISETDRQLIGMFMQELYHFCTDDLGADCEVTWANIADNAYNGPGASIGAVDTSAYGKMYSSELTTTCYSLYSLYKADCRLHAELSIAESIREANCGSPRVVQGSRSTFVPKNVDVSRQISTEPILNGYFQLGLGRVIERRLNRYFGIYFDVQPTLNRWLALRGSEAGYAGLRDYEFSTLDLKAASDSISLGLLASSFPPEWVDVILTLRSPRTEIAGEWHKLSMVSTMGNGFTFPLQTAIFSAVVAASMRLGDLTPEFRGHNMNCSVFGDDLIVPRPVADRVVHLLSLLGFEVNAAKSFISGAFKESCGADFYRGYNIRPFFLRKNDSLQDALVLLNLASEWSSRTQILLPTLCRAIARQIPDIHKYFVPMGESEGAGVRVPLSLANPKTDDNGSYRYRAQIARPARYVLGDESFVSKPRSSRNLVYNPAGLLLAFLRGEIRGGTILTRTKSKSVPYNSRWRIWPSQWDRLPPDPVSQLSKRLAVDGAQLVTVTRHNWAWYA